MRNLGSLKRCFNRPSKSDICPIFIKVINGNFDCYLEFFSEKMKAYLPNLIKLIKYDTSGTNN